LNTVALAADVDYPAPLRTKARTKVLKQGL